MIDPGMKYFHRYLVVLFLLTFASCINMVVAQDRSQDDVELAQLFESEKADITKIRILFEEGRKHWFSRNLQEANFHLREVVEMIGQNGYDTLLADALNLLGNVHLKLQQYDSAFFYLQMALKTGEKNYIPHVDETYSKIYFQLGDYPASLDYALKAAEGFENISDDRFNLLAVYSYAMIGDILLKMNQMDKALSYYHKAYAKGSASSVNWYIKEPLLKIANCYILKNEPEKAKHLYDTIIATAYDFPNHEPTMHAHMGLADVAVKQGEYASAIAHIKTAISYAFEKDLSINFENFYARLGAVFIASGQLDSARRYLEYAVDRSVQSQNFSNLSEAYFYLSEVHRVDRNYPEALRTFQLHKAYHDSILNTEKVRQVHNLEILYQTRKKESEIDQLIEAGKSKDLAIQKRNIYVGFMLVVAVIMGFVLFLLKKNYLHRQRLYQDRMKQIEDRQQVASLQAMINGQEAERTRIARDLHDGLGGLFSTLKMYMSTLKHERPSLQSHSLFQKGYSLIDTAAEEVRRIAHNMMPEVLMKIGLVNALQDLCAGISAGRSLNVSLEVHGMEQRLDATTETMLFRIVQELLTNVIKHAQATEVIIQFVREDNRLSVVVEDNGRGFHEEETGSIRRAGLETIERRVAYLNGKLHIESIKSIGATIMMDFSIK